MQDQRLVTRLQNYWELIRRGKPMPDMSQLNSGAIDDMWQQCMKISAFPTQGGGYSYFSEFMGEKLSTIYGADLSGTPLNKYNTRYPLNIVVGKLDGVMAAKVFMLDENQYINDRGAMVKYRACFMPFGNDAKGVTHIVVGFSGREF